jgi:transposase
MTSTAPFLEELAGMQVQLRGRPVSRKPYPSDVSNEEWAFVAPYLALCREDGSQRVHDLGEGFNTARWMVKRGARWRYMPSHFPPWAAVYQQMRRWIKAGMFEAMVHELRQLLRLGEGRGPAPTAVVDGRTLQSTLESGHRTSYDGHKRKKGASCTWSSTRWATC